MRGLTNIDLSALSWFFTVKSVDFVGRWQSAAESSWGYSREDRTVELWLGRLYFAAERTERPARRTHADDAGEDNLARTGTMATILPFPAPLKPADPLFRQGDTAETALVATTICR